MWYLEAVVNTMLILLEYETADRLVAGIAGTDELGVVHFVSAGDTDWFVLYGRGHSITVSVGYAVEVENWTRKFVLEVAVAMDNCNQLNGNAEMKLSCS
uniref:Uncharacterized protein n=1 Tax=Trichuris muris TaxID=70415 RepID=A0A5S6R576_TRIMR